MELDKVELLWLEVSAQCGCGEPLARGEQVGFEPTAKELLCLWCLADLRAGRPRPRHRAPRADASGPFGAAVTHPAPAPSMPADPWAGDSAPSMPSDPWSASPTPSMPIDPWASPSEPYPAGSPMAPVPARQRRSGPGTASTLIVAVLLVALALLVIPHLIARGAAVNGPGTGCTQRSGTSRWVPHHTGRPVGIGPGRAARARGCAIHPAQPDSTEAVLVHRLHVPAHHRVRTSGGLRPVPSDPPRGEHR